MRGGNNDCCCRVLAVYGMRGNNRSQQRESVYSCFRDGKSARRSRSSEQCVSGTASANHEAEECYSEVVQKYHICSKAILTKSCWTHKPSAKSVTSSSEDAIAITQSASSWMPIRTAPNKISTSKYWTQNYCIVLHFVMPIYFKCLLHVDRLAFVNERYSSVGHFNARIFEIHAMARVIYHLFVACVSLIPFAVMYRGQKTRLRQLSVKPIIDLHHFQTLGTCLIEKRHARFHHAL